MRRIGWMRNRAIFRNTSAILRKGKDKIYAILDLSKANVNRTLRSKAEQRGKGARHTWEMSWNFATLQNIFRV